MREPPPSLTGSMAQGDGHAHWARPHVCPRALRPGGGGWGCGGHLWSQNFKRVSCLSFQNVRFSDRFECIASHSFRCLEWTHGWLTGCLQDCAREVFGPARHNPGSGLRWKLARFLAWTLAHLACCLFQRCSCTLRALRLGQSSNLFPRRPSYVVPRCSMQFGIEFCFTGVSEIHGIACISHEWQVPSRMRQDFHHPWKRRPSFWTCSWWVRTCMFVYCFKDSTEEWVPFDL